MRGVKGTKTVNPARVPKGAFRHGTKCRRSPWSAADEEAAVAMRLTGHPCAAIGLAVGKTTAAVVTRLVKLGVRVTPPTRPWTPDEDDRLRAMRADGVKAVVIGRRLKRTASAVSHRVEYLGLPRVAPLPPSEPDLTRAAVAVLHARGLTDGEVARELGLAGKTAARGVRVRLGLPANIDHAGAGRRSGAARAAKKVRAASAPKPPPVEPHLWRPS